MPPRYAERRICEQSPCQSNEKIKPPSPTSGKSRESPIFQAVVAYTLIIQPTKQPHASACGSPAPALTLGPKRTWRNGRRSRLQLECPRGNPRRRTAQIRGTLKASGPSQSRAKPGSREGVETRRGAPKAARPRRPMRQGEGIVQTTNALFFKGRRRKPKRQENLLLARECGFESRRPHQWGALGATDRYDPNNGKVFTALAARA